MYMQANLNMLFVSYKIFFLLNVDTHISIYECYILAKIILKRGHNCLGNNYVIGNNETK